jgi:uncharacterized membrane protein (DUF2068 family)
MDNVSMKRPIPIGVKIIAIFFYIVSVVVFFAAGYFIIGTIINFGEITKISPVFLIIAGFFYIGYSVLNFFIARGLWKGKNWARITAIVISIIMIIYGIISIPESQLSLNHPSTGSALISIIIGGYLWFSKSVKAAFGK